MLIRGIAIATVVSFVLSAVFYALPPVARTLARDSSPNPRVPVPAQMATVVVRGLLVAALIAGLLAAAGWHGAVPGLLLGLALCVLPIVLLAGSVIHENVPVRVAAVHTIDWVLKLAVTGLLVGLFV